MKEYDSIPDHDASDEKLEELRKLKAHMEQGQSVLTCPSCQANLRFNMGKLTPSSHSPATASELQQVNHGISQMTLMLSSMRRKAELKAQLQGIEAAYPTIKEVKLGQVLTLPQCDDIRGKIYRLKAITHTPSPLVSSREMTESFNYNSINEQIASVTLRLQDVSKRIPNHNQTLGMVTTEIERIRSLIMSSRERINEVRRMDAREGEIAKQLSTLSSSIDNTIEAKINTIASEKLKLEAEVRQAEMFNRAEAERIKLVSLDSEARTHQQRFTTLTRMKQLAIETEGQLLHNVADQINQTLSDIGSILFDDPIDISLQLHHVTKTTGRVEPKVNINISYKGGEYDGLGYLSGGESDRVSLALTLALSQLYPSPLLLLDECMSSLDGQVREACLKAIRKYGVGKTVVCINHESIEGHYDKVISL